MTLVVLRLVLVALVAKAVASCMANDVVEVHDVVAVAVAVNEVVC